jgi:hypothetical protein
MKLSPNTLRRLALGAGLAVSLGCAGAALQAETQQPSDAPEVQEPQAFPGEPAPSPSPSPSVAASPGPRPDVGCPSGNASPKPDRDPCVACGMG